MNFMKLQRIRELLDQATMPDLAKPCLAYPGIREAFDEAKRPQSYFDGFAAQMSSGPVAIQGKRLGDVVSLVDYRNERKRRSDLDRARELLRSALSGHH